MKLNFFILLQTKSRLRGSDSRVKSEASITHQRESVLRHVETIGGLALDVTAADLTPKLLQTYLRVKERGLL